MTAVGQGCQAANRQYGCGSADKSWRGKPLPLNLAFMGMPKCSLLVSWDLTAPVFALNTATTWKILVPMDSGLLGAEFFNQLWIQDASANPAGIATSNGGRGVVGR